MLLYREMLLENDENAYFLDHSLAVDLLSGAIVLIHIIRWKTHAILIQRLQVAAIIFQNCHVVIEKKNSK